MVKLYRYVLEQKITNYFLQFDGTKVDINNISKYNDITKGKCFKCTVIESNTNWSSIIVPIENELYNIINRLFDIKNNNNTNNIGNNE